MGKIMPRRLRVEYLENPLAVEASRPRLSWRAEQADGAEGARQTAWQVLAASSEEALERGEADLWDSGKVESADCVQIPYGGPELAPRECCWWKVRLWDEEDAPSEYSETARWCAALGDEPWQAQWIGFDEPLEHEAQSPEPVELTDGNWIGRSDAPTGKALNVDNVQAGWAGRAAYDAPLAVAGFRRRVHVPAGAEVRRAWAAFAGADQFTLYINGVPAMQSDGRHGAWMRPVQEDATDLFVEGDNIIAAEARFQGHWRPVLLGRCGIEFDDGSSIEVETDEEWKVQDALPPGWVGRDFDDSGWSQAEIIRPASATEGGGLGLAPMLLPPARYFRCSFDADRPVRRARLYATALGSFEAYCNGRLVSEDILRPGWTDFRQRALYQCYDVSELLREGDNALGFILAAGWCTGYMGKQVRPGGYYEQPRLMAQVVVEYEDGEEAVVGTSELWRAAHGPVVGADIYNGEQYDARRELGPWSQVGYDDSAWAQASVDDSASVQFQANPGPPVRRVMALRPKSVHSPAPGVHIFDMGQNLVGWARITVQGPEGAKIALRHGEALDEKGALYVDNLRGARAQDEYWLKGERREVYEPRFTFHGFRYLEVAGWPGTPSVDDVQGIVVHSEMEQSGGFECSHELLNRLQHNIEWGQRGNFLEVPTDCPQRDERLGWMGDAQIFVDTGCFNFDAAAFFTKWMDDVSEAQTDEGGFTNVAPDLVAVGSCSPAWADAGVIVPWTLWQWYGDDAIIRRHYDSMRRWLEWLEGNNPEGLWMENFGSGFGDWLNVDDFTPLPVLASAFYAHDARLMAEMAEAVGREEEARHYRGLHEKAARAFRDRFQGEDGRIESDSQTAYVLALRFGLLDAQGRSAAVEHLVRSIDERGGHLTTGFVGCGHILFALSEHGRLDKAYELLLQESYPSWLYSIHHGATTIWERWDGWTEETGFQTPLMNSFNHYSFGAVGSWMYKVVAGIDLLEPGFRRVRIGPRPGGGLQWARASYDSVRGRISSRWAYEGDMMRLEAVIPPNAAGEWWIPAASGADVDIQGPEGFTADMHEADGRTRIELPPGTYTAQCPRPEEAL